MNDIERQIRLESDAVRDGNLRHAKNREYQLATDLKPARDLVGNCLDSLSGAILDVQMRIEGFRRPEATELGNGLLIAQS